MARRVGDRNRDFDSKRQRILDALEPRLLAPDGALVTMNEMASVADVSLSSLRHHLGDRGQIWAAVLERYGAKGEPFLRLVAMPTDAPLADSLHHVLSMITIGLRHGLLDMMGNGMAVGLREPVAGPAYLHHLLEPVLASLESRLGHHAAKGELPPCDLRLAALFLVAPLLLAALHQGGLGGCEVRPLSLEQVVDEAVGRFVRAYGPAVA
jgi:AcrR family transcriptional regulator